MDLTAYLKENRKHLEKSPMGLYSIAQIPNTFKEELEEGVIFLLEQVSGEVNHLEKNPLHPYYLVYITKKQEIKLSYDKGKQILDLYKKIGYKNDELYDRGVEQFNQATDYGSKMDEYSNLLEKVIEEIVGQKEELGIESLFHRGGTSIVEDGTDGLEDFELISFLILEA